MIRFGMHSSLWGPAWTRETAEVAVREAAQHGLQVIEVAVLEPEKIDIPHSVALFRQHGVAPTASLALPQEVTASLHPEKATAFLLKALDAAHALGSNTLAGFTQSTLGYRTGVPPTEAELDNVARALKPVAKKAADYGMTLGLEPCNRYETHLTNTAKQTRALIERIGEPNCMIHLDTYHMNIEEKGFRAGLADGGELVKYIHLSESDRGVPGTGNVDWEGAFRAIRDLKFSGDLVIESFVTMMPQLAAALSVWRPVAKDRHEVLTVGVPYVLSLARVHGLA